MMGYTGNLWPLQKSYEDDPEGLSPTLTLEVIGIIYLALAAAGTAKIFAKHMMTGPQMWCVTFLIAFCILRTAFLTRIEAPEPRYVLECFPVIYALGAFLWTRQTD